MTSVPLPQPRDTGTDCCDDDDDEEGGGLLESYSPLEKNTTPYPYPQVCGAPAISLLPCLLPWLAAHEPHGRPRSSSRFILMELFLFNPITRSRIPLPSLSITANYSHRGALSAPPTDSECIILFVDLEGVFLHQLGGGSGWTRAMDSFQDMAYSAITCRGKFYCQYYFMRVDVADPRLPEPRMLLFDWNLDMPRLMDCDFLSEPSLCGDRYCLVEHDGEVCILLTGRLEPATIKELRLFRVDLSAKEWVRVETLSDRVILIDWPCTLSLVAVDVGFKKNTIYFG